MRLSGLPDGNIHRLAIAAELDGVLDLNLILLVAVLSHERLEDFLPHALFWSVLALRGSIDEVQYGFRLDDRSLVYLHHYESALPTESNPPLYEEPTADAPRCPAPRSDLRVSAERNAVVA